MAGLLRKYANRKITHKDMGTVEALIPMKSNQSQTRLGLMALVTVALALLLATAGNAPAVAQQGVPFNPNQPPPTRSQQNGSVLELPTTPGRQSGTTGNIPQIAPQQGQELTLPSRQLRAQTGYEQVTVTVTQDGRYVTGLNKNDFKLYVDGQLRSIQFFRQDLNTPVSVGILVDTSGSMAPKIPQASAAISQFISDLNPRDDVFMFAFSSQPFLLQPFTTNHYLVLSRLSLLHAYGQTALYDTILDGLLMLQHGRWDKKALLVVTDGMDNASQSGLNQVIAQAHRMGVLVYSIGIGDPNSSKMPSLIIGPLMLGGDIDEVDARTLKTLSTETGAKTYIIKEVGDGAALQQACADISRELREQYTVGFVAPDASRGGYRNLRVDVPSHPEVAVRVRKGVEVGNRSAYAMDPPGP
ncbi:MAG: VWA domain-containing protein [Candidatus Binataceae bacterium]